jgi:hypothetical protein
MDHRRPTNLDAVRSSDSRSLVAEPIATVNTGDTPSALTAERRVV